LRESVPEARHIRQFALGGSLRKGTQLSHRLAAALDHDYFAGGGLANQRRGVNVKFAN
jgi:hypothetical protein